MNIAPSIDNMLLFVLLVVPGLISIHVYRLLMPAKDIDWKTVSVEALFYSSLNFAIFIPLLIPINNGTFPEAHPVAYACSLLAPLLIGPAVWPVLIWRAYKWDWLMKYLQYPYPTSWDYFFDKRKPVYALVHLKSGTKIGGFYGQASYATSFPRHGSIYLERVIKVDDAGKFIGVIEGTKGVLLEKDTYDFIEFFEFSQQQENGNV